MSILTLGLWVVGIYFAVVAALNALPDYDDYPLPEEIFSGIQTVLGYGMAWDDVFPFTTLMYCAFLMMTFQVAAYAWKGFRWVLGMARGGGTA